MLIAVGSVTEGLETKEEPSEAAGRLDSNSLRTGIVCIWRWDWARFRLCKEVSWSGCRRGRSDLLAQ